jgi:hypothetical protein
VTPGGSTLRHVTAEPVNDQDPDERLRRLVEALPGAVIVIDEGGAIRFATEPAAKLVEVDPAELVGRSVLDFVDEETAWAYAAAVAMAGDFPDVVTGPLRVTIVADNGENRSADLWAVSRLHDPVLEGIVCLLTPETASLGLGEAVMAIATEAPFTTVVARVTRAMRGHPTVARAVLLSPAGAGWRIVGEEQTPDLPPMGATGPWATAAETGVRSLADGLEDLPENSARVAEALGYQTAWAEPVGAPSVRGVLVLWRQTRGRPTPNELNVLHQAASILALAWAQHDR